jgi:hypothetical protein
VNFALAIAFGGGGNTDSGPSGGLIVLAVLLVLVAVPAAIGVALRMRDKRRGGVVPGEETRRSDPSASPDFGWGNVPNLRGAKSTPSDWMIVGAFALVVLALLVATLA